MGGGGGGPMFGGGRRAEGLPFAGIPPELQDGVDKILATEPDHGEERVEFNRIPEDKRPFTLRRFFGPYRWPIFGSFLFIVAETLTGNLGPLLTGSGLDYALRGRFGLVLKISIAYFLAVALSTITGRIRLAWTGRVGERLMFALRVRVFTHLQRLGLDFYTHEKAGRIMTRMTSDIENLQQLFSDGIVQLLVQGLTLIIVSAVLFVKNVELAAYTVGVVVPILFVMTVWFRRVSDRAFLTVRDRIADVLADLSESLSGIRIITAYNRQRYNTIKHRNIIGAHRDANNYTAKVSAYYGPGTDAVGSLAQGFIMLLGGGMVIAGIKTGHITISIGTLVAFVLYIQSFFAPIQQLVSLYNTYQQGRAAVVKLSEVLATEPSVPEDPNATDLPPVQGRITFDHVTFEYEPGRVVLRDVDLDIKAGETFAFVGPTGAGKSTIVKLIARLYDPQQGRVLIDGHDIKRVTQTSLREQIGNVPQESFLFAGSIKDNIAFGRPDTTDEEVWEAIRAVGIEYLIDRFPQGIDQPVHERGVSLSSGERQLIALARAFHARPRVLILDEATSNLDLRTEAKIEHALDVLLEGRTAIIVAHRLSTVMRADRIAVVSNGRITEVGSHDELVARGGEYAELYETWMTHTGQASLLGAP
jgi:ATP-binding cassette subfamily B protein